MSTRHSDDWFVPVRSHDDIATLHTGRLPNGLRVGIAFTSLAGLHAAIGPRQQWLRMSADALHDLLAPLGITRIQLDPALVAVPVTAVAAS